MNDDEKKELDEKFLDLVRKVEKENEGTLKGAGFIVEPNVEAALACKLKSREARNKRIEERKRLQKDKEKSDEADEE